MIWPSHHETKTKKGVVSAEEDALERRGFRDGVHFRLGAIEAD